MSPPPDPEGWRHLRLMLTGPNASGHTHYLSLSGLEVYGEVRGLADNELGTCVHVHTCTVHVQYCNSNDNNDNNDNDNGSNRLNSASLPLCTCTCSS